MSGAGEHRLLFAALVDAAGGVDAAAAVIAWRWGASSPSHVSRMCGGSVGVTLEAVVALEDALARRPVTSMLAERCARHGPGRIAARDRTRLGALAAELAIEAGEAVAALVSGIGRPDAEGHAAAVKECQEAREVLGRLLAALDQDAAP